jgi:hypothetical protein
VQREMLLERLEQEWEGRLGGEGGGGGVGERWAGGHRERSLV